MMDLKVQATQAYWRTATHTIPEDLVITINRQDEIAPPQMQP
jgi:hypothetical protein